MLMIFDFGNARGKWFIPRQNISGDFLHAVAELSETEWRSIVGRGKPPHGFLKVNGTPYAVGDIARRYTLSDKPRGAARYNEMYYGAGLSFAMVEAIGKTSNVVLYASHAPQDQQYASNLIRAAKHVWKVECLQGTLEFDVRGVKTFDEPLGGYAHYTLTEDGDEKRNNPVHDKTSLVVDVGGYTADQATIDGGILDPLSIKSRRIGTLAALETFETELRAKYKNQFQDIGNLDIKRVEAAMINGFYQFGKIKLDCVDLAAGIVQALANDVIQIIKSAGGVANYDVILLTGGGSALIYNALVSSLPQIDFVLVEPDIARLKFANVYGGAKIAAMLSRTKENA